MVKNHQSDHTLPILAHILGLVTSFLGPLIILLVAEDEHAKNHARLALNWQLSLLIYSVVAIGMIFTIILAIIAVPALIAMAILNIVFPIIAAVRAGEGRLWSYPLTIPFLQTR